MNSEKKSNFLVNVRHKEMHARPEMSPSETFVLESYPGKSRSSLVLNYVVQKTMASAQENRIANEPLLESKPLLEAKTAIMHSAAS